MKSDDVFYVHYACGIVLCILLAFAPNVGEAQTRYIDRTGKASFFSSAPMEDIEAHTEQVITILDAGSGEIVSNVLMRSFNFRKSLMQKHFNEHYVESDEFPKATFRGMITNLDSVTLDRDGTYTLAINGDMTIHGVTKPLKVRVPATVRNGEIQANATFPIRVKDFDIKIPRLVIRNIAEVVEVKVSVNLKPMEL